jgi:hypothetical protein
VRMLYDFRCEDNHTTESYVSGTVTEQPCKTCSKPAQRIISPVRAMLDPISGDFPDATRKWAKDRQKKIALERKRENS